MKVQHKSNILKFSNFKQYVLSPKSMQIQMLLKQVLLSIGSVWNHHFDSVLQPDQ